MREGFNEYGEPTLTQMDDYKGTHSLEKRKMIRWVIVSGLILGLFYAAARLYFWDKGEKEISIPKEQRIMHY